MTKIIIFRVITRSLTVVLGLSVCSISGYLLYLALKKDNDDDYSDTYNTVSKFKVSEVSVPKEMVKVLIGRGGKNIKQIQEQSNTRISFQERENKDTLCVIRGSIEACHMAENLIQEFINNQPVVECEDLFIPQQCVSRIIGRDGERIRDLCARSGAKICVDNDRVSVSRRVTIKGSREQICVAKSLIDEIVELSLKTQDQVETSLAKREPRLPPKSNDNPKVIGSPKVERISPVPGKTLLLQKSFTIYCSTR